MACFNKVIIVGNLTRDPQLSYLPSQTAVVEFGLASNRRWRGQNGEQREETCFIDCRCFGKQAETFNQYMTKGQQVLIEGRLSFDMWEDKEGQKRSKHRITVERFVFMGAPRGQGQQGQGQPSQGAARQAAPPPPPAEPPPSDADYQPEPPPTGEDIPF